MYSASYAAQHRRDVVNISRGLRLLVTACRMKKRITINSPKESVAAVDERSFSRPRPRIDAIHGGNLPVLNVYSNTRKCGGVGFFFCDRIL